VDLKEAPEDAPPSVARAAFQKSSAKEDEQLGVLSGILDNLDAQSRAMKGELISQRGRMDNIDTGLGTTTERLKGNNRDLKTILDD